MVYLSLGWVACKIQVLYNDNYNTLLQIQQGCDRSVISLSFLRQYKSPPLYNWNIVESGANTITFNIQFLLRVKISSFFQIPKMKAVLLKVIWILWKRNHPLTSSIKVLTKLQFHIGRVVQHYVIKFVSDLWQVCGFLRFPPPIKLAATI